MMNEQITLFEELYPTYKINKHIKLIELFGGIGFQSKALDNLHADYERHVLVEFDKWCIQSYNAIHNTNFVANDIRNIHGEDLEITDTEHNTYVMTYSFPCTDLSNAGTKQGMAKGSNTRSGLLWEVERLLNECKQLGSMPEVLIMENVPMIHSEVFYKDFVEWQLVLENLGYSNYWKDLNAKDYGIPQNRERTFMVSILGNYNFTFPKKQKLETRLKDFLDSVVDEKYYLTNEQIKSLKITTYATRNYKYSVMVGGQIANNLCARGYKEPKCVEVGQANYKGHESINRIYFEDGLAPTLTTVGGGHREVKVMIHEIKNTRSN